MYSIGEDAGTGLWTLRYAGGSPNGWASGEELNLITLQVEYEDGRDTRRFVIAGHVEATGARQLQLRPPVPRAGTDWHSRPGETVFMSFHLREEPTPAAVPDALVDPVGEPGSFVAFLSSSTPGGPVVLQTVITIIVGAIALARAPRAPAGVVLAAVVLVSPPWVPVLFGYGEPMAAVLVAFNVVVGRLRLQGLRSPE